MKYETANAFRTALESRLLARATSDNIPLIRLRKLVVFDRLIARLMIVAPDRWVLKGAVALQFRAGPGYRTTKDIDFGELWDEEAATSDLLAVQSVDLGDYFSFTIERQGPMDLGDAGGSAVRYHARAELAGRMFETFVLDVAFGERGELVDVLHGPDLLGFADISPARLPVVSLERHIAEKVHAYVSLYRGGRHSSRVKDLVDLAMIESAFEVKADRLEDAIAETFSDRDGEPPKSLPQPPDDWRVPYRKLANEVGLDPEIEAAYQLVRRWIDPLVSGSVERGSVWDPAGHLWRQTIDRRSSA
jgi:predicted nucleotidyltransferase component of viral defense system